MYGTNCKPNCKVNCQGMNEITPEQINYAWQSQITDGHLQQQTPLTIAFFSIQNIHYLKNEIEKNLRHYTDDPRIKLVLTQEFAQSMIDMAYRNQIHAHSPEVGLQLLNKWLINKETEIISLSLRKRKQYERWILKGDRMRIFPYGLGDRTLHVRGENQQTQSPYLLNHPWKSQYQAYLRDVLMTECPTRPAESSLSCQYQP